MRKLFSGCFVLFLALSAFAGAPPPLRHTWATTNDSQTVSNRTIAIADSEIVNQGSNFILRVSGTGSGTTITNFTVVGNTMVDSNIFFNAIQVQSFLTLDSVTNGTNVAFSGGQIFPPGKYTVRYVTGALLVSPGGWSVAEWDLNPNPSNYLGCYFYHALDQTGNTNSYLNAGGHSAFSSQALAQNFFAGSIAMFTTTNSGPIGLTFFDNLYGDNSPGSPNPTFELDAITTNTIFSENDYLVAKPGLKSPNVVASNLTVRTTTFLNNSNLQISYSGGQDKSNAKIFVTGSGTVLDTLYTNSGTADLFQASGSTNGIVFRPDPTISDGTYVYQIIQGTNGFFTIFRTNTAFDVQEILNVTTNLLSQYPPDGTVATCDCSFGQTCGFQLTLSNFNNGTPTNFISSTNYPINIVGPVFINGQVISTFPVSTNTAPTGSTNKPAIDKAVGDYFFPCDTTVVTIGSGQITTFIAADQNYFLRNPLPPGAVSYTVSAIFAPPDVFVGNRFGGVVGYQYTIFYPAPTGTVSTTPTYKISALNNLIVNLKAANLWTNQFDEFLANAGGDPTCDAQNLLDITNYTVAYNGFLATSAAHTRLGTSNNASGGYAAINWNFQTSRVAATNNVSFTAWIVNQQSTNLAPLLLFTDTNANPSVNIASAAWPSTTAPFLLNGIGSTNTVPLPNPVPFTTDLFVSVSRTNNTITSTYGASNFTATAATAYDSGSNIFLFGNSVSNISAGTISVMAIGKALTTNQTATLFGILQQFASDMSRLQGSPPPSVVTVPQAPPIDGTKIQNGTVNSNAFDALTFKNYTNAVENVGTGSGSSTNVFVGAGTHVTVVTNTAGSVYTVSADTQTNNFGNAVNGNTNFMKVLAATNADNATSATVAGTAMNALNFSTPFMLTNNITDPTAKLQLFGFASEMAKYGITNFDLLAFGSQFRPTNSFTTFQGRPFSATNIQWLTGGALFTNSQITVSNLPDGRTGTVFVAWHNMAGVTPTNNDEWLTGYESSSNGAAIFQRWNLNNWAQAIARPSSTPIDLLSNIILWPSPRNFYDYTFPYLVNQACTQRRVSTVSIWGTNTAVWLDGNQAQLNFFSPALVNTNNPVLTNSLDTLAIGRDLFQTTVGHSFAGVIDAVLIVWQGNGLATTNVIYGGNRALLWLEPSHKLSRWVTDSTGLPLQNTDASSFPFWKQQQDIFDTTWEDYAVSGSQASDFDNAYAYNFLFGMGVPSWITENEIQVAVGDNDFYNNGVVAATAFLHLTNLVASAKSNAVEVSMWTPYVIWTNSTSLAYSIPGTTNIVAFSLMVQTNRSLFHNIYRRDLFLTQSLLNTNSGGISTDGTHLNGTNNVAAQMLVANIPANTRSVVNWDSQIVSDAQNQDSLLLMPPSVLTNGTTTVQWTNLTTGTAIVLGYGANPSNVSFMPDRVRFWSGGFVPDYGKSSWANVMELSVDNSALMGGLIGSFYDSVNGTEDIGLGSLYFNGSSSITNWAARTTFDGNLLILNTGLAKHYGGLTNGVALPSITVNVSTSGSGTGATATLDANATDSSGEITLTTGTLVGGGATIFTNTFGTAYTSTPHISWAARNAVAAALSGLTMVYPSTVVSNKFIFSVGATGLGASTTYVWDYKIEQ